MAAVPRPPVLFTRGRTEDMRRLSRSLRAHIAHRKDNVTMWCGFGGINPRAFVERDDAVGSVPTTVVVANGCRSIAIDTRCEDGTREIAFFFDLRTDAVRSALASLRLWRSVPALPLASIVRELGLEPTTEFTSTCREELLRNLPQTLEGTISPLSRPTVELSFWYCEEDADPPTGQDGKPCADV